MTKNTTDFEYKKDGRWPALKEQIDGYAAWLSEHGRTPKRCAEVRWRIEHVFRLLYNEFGVLEPGSVTPDMVQWIRDEKDRVCSHPNAARSYCQALGHFCYWTTGFDPWDALTTSLRTRDMEAYIKTRCMGIGFDDEFSAYLDKMDRMGLRPETKLNRVRGAATCIVKLRGSRGDFSLSDLGDEDINWLRNEFSDVKETSLRNYLGSLGLFCQFVTGRNPYREADINWNSIDSVNRKFIFDEDWFKLVGAANTNEYLVLVLGVAMGLRSGEIASIRLEDIDGDRLTIHGKGHGPKGKEEVVRMPPEVIDAINEWLPVRQRIIEDNGDRSDGKLLVNPHYRPGKGLASSGVAAIVRGLCERTGVVMSPHSMRRLFATTLYDGGTDLVVLRTLMRHSKIDTTLDCYIHADPRKQEAAMDSLRLALFRPRPSGGGSA